MVWYKSKIRLSVILSVALIVSGANYAHAITTIGGIDFEDNAFADLLVTSSGVWTFGGTTLESSLVGSADSVFAFSDDPAAFVTLMFTNNTVTNIAGPDIAIFDLGSVDTFRVVINGVANLYTSVPVANPFPLNVALIDIGDFSVPAGDMIDTLTLFSNPPENSGSATDFTVIAGITVIETPDNSSGSAVPEPITATLSLMGLGVLGMATRRRVV